MQKCSGCKKHRIALVVTLIALCVSTALYIQARRRQCTGDECKKVFTVKNR